jgi:hypothetical protein
MPDHANDNDTEQDMEQSSMVKEHISDAESGHGILAQFSKYVNGRAAND